MYVVEWLYSVVEMQSNGSRTAVESTSRRSCNHGLITGIIISILSQICVFSYRRSSLVDSAEYCGPAGMRRHDGGIAVVQRPVRQLERHVRR